MQSAELKVEILWSCVIYIKASTKFSCVKNQLYLSDINFLFHLSLCFMLSLFFFSSCILCDMLFIPLSHLYTSVFFFCYIYFSYPKHVPKLPLKYIYLLKGRGKSSGEKLPSVFYSRMSHKKIKQISLTLSRFSHWSVKFPYLYFEFNFRWKLFRNCAFFGKW